MLNLLVRLMKTHSLLPLLILFFAQDFPVAITSPRAGDVLRGQVSVIGSTDVPNFLSAQLDFAYASDSTDGWFALQAFPQPALDSPLFLWDTASITDGDYQLRLRVTLTDGAIQEVIIPVTIQNDALLSPPTPLPTSTPASGIGVQIPTPFLLAASPTPTEIPRPTPTPLPANPAALNRNDIYASLSRGALVIIGLFIFSAIILRLRNS